MKAIPIVFLLVFTGISYTFADCITLIVATTDALCNGDSSGSATATIVSGGIPPYSFDWSNGDTTQTATGLAAGLYMVTVTDSTGTCTGDTSFIINEPLPISFNVISTAASCPTCCDVCVNVINLSGGCVPYTLLWVPSDPNWPIPCSGCAGTTYTVTVTDNCGCTLLDSITPDTVPVGIDATRQQPQGGSVMVYPNPAKDILFVKLGEVEGKVNYSIYDLLGRKVKSGELEPDQSTITLQHLKAGLYIIRFSGQAMTESRKFVKKN